MEEIRGKRLTFLHEQEQKFNKTQVVLQVFTVVLVQHVSLQCPCRVITAD